MRCLKLPFSFDPERLRADLAQVCPDEWIPHQNKRHYDGQWSGAALRAIGGASDNLIPDATAISDFRATPLLERCPYFRELLARFECPLQSVRLLRLHAGSHIAEHVDHALDFDDGEVRLHVPIITHEAVHFYVDAARVIMAPGECWYTNVNLPHSVENHSTIDRVHLVLDCRVDAWLRDLFHSTPPPADDASVTRRHLATTAGVGAVLDFLDRFVAARNDGATFRCDRETFIVEWRARHTWQLRLCVQPAGAGWSANMETSPDPEKQYAPAVAEFIAAVRHGLPDAELREAIST